MLAKSSRIHSHDGHRKVSYGSRLGIATPVSWDEPAERILVFILHELKVVVFFSIFAEPKQGSTSFLMATSFATFIGVSAFLTWVFLKQTRKPWVKHTGMSSFGGTLWTEPSWGRYQNWKSLFPENILNSLEIYSLILILFLSQCWHRIGAKYLS